MTRFLTMLDRVVGGIVIALFVLLFLVISFQIISRYFLSEPFTWTEECARFLFIWICFLGTTIAFSKRSHVTVDFFVSKFSSGYRSGISVFVQILTIFFWLILIFQGAWLAQRGAFLEAVTVPWLHWGHIYSAVPVSASLMLLYSIGHLSQTLSELGVLLRKKRGN